MERKRLYAPALLVWLAFGWPVWGATVTTRDGSVVTGEVSGRVAFKSRYVEVEQEGHKYGVYFYLIADGASVTEVTSEGVKLKGGDSTLLLISWDLAGKGKAPSDAEALGAEHKEMGPNEIAFGWLNQSGADVCRVSLGVSKPQTVNEVFGAIKGWMSGSSPAFQASPPLGSILGEWKADNLTPALTIQEAAGPRKVAVSQIVAFK
jgi:hypothetical protein